MREMSKSKKKKIGNIDKICLIVLSTILPLLAISCFALIPSLTNNGLANTQNIPIEVDSRVSIRNLTVWHIGSSQALNNILGQMQPMGPQIKSLELRVSKRNSSVMNGTESTITGNGISVWNGTESIIVVNNLSLFLFDGDWISKRVNDAEFHMFLREAVSNGAKLVATGVMSSKLYEALDKAEVYRLGRDENGNIRNPVAGDPLLVGFKLKYAVTPDGHKYSVPAIFATCTGDFSGAVQDLTDWLGGK